MTLLEQCTRRIIECIHGLPYEECIIARRHTCGKIPCDGSCYENDAFEEDIDNFPVTIGRVMQALANVHGEWIMSAWDNGVMHIDNNVNWQLTKENGQECTLEDQTEETLNKLLELLG